MKPWILAVVVILQDPKPEQVVPLKDGSVWTYQVKDSTFSVKVAGTEKVGDVDCRVLETNVGGQLQRDYFALRPEGLVSLKVAVGGREVVQDPPVLRLKFPLRKGDSWEWKAKQGGDSPKGRVSFDNEGEEEIRVPAGTFKAWKIVSSVEVEGGTSTSIYWYAAGTGLVRQDTCILVKGELIKVVAELKSYEPGK